VRNADGSTALSSAAFFGRVELLQLLLAEGADPAARSQTGDTPLNATVAPWNVTKFVADLFGVTLDREGVEAGRKRCAEILRALEKPATPDARLLEALRTGDKDAVERALAEGASLTALDARSGMSPLATAAFHGREELARLLFARGANVQLRNQDGASALHGAALAGHVALIELLLERDAEVDARDAKGSTPLHAAAFLGRAEAVSALLHAGAIRAPTDTSGQTPLDLTRTAWSITEYVLGLLGLEVERSEVEAGREACAKLLRP
jgi:ankyrin repeat protein